MTNIIKNVIKKDNIIDRKNIIKHHIKISVVVLNWNGKHLLRDCLKSLTEQDFGREMIDYEIILVDNASTDGSVKYVKDNFPRVIIVENKENYGFCKGNNIGIDNSRGEYVFILNNDTKIDKNCLSELYKTAKTSYPETINPYIKLNINPNIKTNNKWENKKKDNEKIGMVSAKMLYMDTDKVDSLGLKLKMLGYTEDLKDETEEPFCPCGGAAFYKKQMLDEIRLNGDYFDSDYFIYADDFDLGFRARLLGWECRLAKKAIVHHIHGATMRKETDKQIYLGDRNRIWTIVKNYSCWLILKYSPFLISVQAFTFFKYTFRGKFIPIFKSKLDSILKMPKMLKKRKLIQNKKLANTGDIEYFFR